MRAWKNRRKTDDDDDDDDYTRSLNSLTTHTHRKQKLNKASEKLPGETRMSSQGLEAMTQSARGWTRGARDQSRSVESREHDASTNGRAAWHVRPAPEHHGSL